MDSRLKFTVLALLVLTTRVGAQEEHGHHGHHQQAQEDEPLVCHDLHHDFADAEMCSERFDRADRVGWQKPDEALELNGVVIRVSLKFVGMADTRDPLSPVNACSCSTTSKQRNHSFSC